MTRRRRRSSGGNVVLQRNQEASGIGVYYDVKWDGLGLAVGDACPDAVPMVADFAGGIHTHSWHIRRLRQEVPISNSLDSP